MQKKKIQANKEEIHTKKGEIQSMQQVKHDKKRKDPNFLQKEDQKENTIAKSKINKETRNGTNLETKEASKKVQK